MTLIKLYNIAIEKLKNANIENYAFDTMQIFTKVFGITRYDFSILKEKEVPLEKASELLQLIEERSKNRPLQYILGICNFMGYNFKVGQGVLIPRDDTEVLVQTAYELIKKDDQPYILDLCSGSGIIAVTLAKLLPKSKILALELSDMALMYLNENIKLNNVQKQVKVLKYDVLNKKLPIFNNNFDLIVSNPPYIATKDIIFLQKEVQKEPHLALDGGDNGVDFYKAIAQNWINILKNNAFVCVEIGYNQGKIVYEIFQKAKLKNITIKKDINNLDRVVSAKKYNY